MKYYIQLDASYERSSLMYKSPRLTWYRPTTLEELLQLKTQYPDAKIVTGNTEIGMQPSLSISVYS
jgi:xanthine dehydrogenase/oxidase